MNPNTSSHRSLAARLEELKHRIRQTDEQWQCTRAALTHAGNVQFVVDMPEPVNAVVDPPKGLRA